MGSLVKGMDPFSLAASGVSSIFNLGGQIATNKSNQKINQQNIAAAYNMQDRANDFSREMFVAQNQEYDRRFQKESDYNSASSQRERLEAAGLNPYMMMDGGSAGVGSSTPASAPSGASGSVPASIPKNALRMEWDANNVRQAIDNKKAKEETGIAESENIIAQSNAAVIETRNQLEIEKLRKEAYKLGIDIDVAQETKDALIQKAKYDSDYTGSLLRGQELSNAAQQIGLPFIAPMAMLNLQKSVEDVLNSRETRNLIKAQTNESYKRAALLIQQEVTERLRQDGIKLDNDEKEKLTEYIVNDAINNGFLLQMEVDNKRRDQRRQAQRDNALGGFGGDLSNFGEYLQEFVGLKGLFKFGGK